MNQADKTIIKRQCKTFTTFNDWFKWAIHTTL